MNGKNLGIFKSCQDNIKKNEGSIERSWVEGGVMREFKFYLENNKNFGNVLTETKAKKIDFLARYLHQIINKDSLFRRKFAISYLK